MNDPRNNASHAEGATYRHGGLRTTFRPDWSKERPWICVRNGEVLAVACATAQEAMRELGVIKASRWSYTA